MIDYVSPKITSKVNISNAKSYDGKKTISLQIQLQDLVNRSKMELRHVTPNIEIVVASNIHHMNDFVLKYCEN